MEKLKKLSDGEKEEFDTLCGLWLDPRVKKIRDLTVFIKSGDYEGLIKNAGELGKILETQKLGELDLEKEKMKNVALTKKFTQIFAEGLIKNNIQLLLKNKINIDPDFMTYLGGGNDGHVFQTENGTAFKITSNKEEAEAANKIKGQNLNYIINISDVFFFTKDQLKNKIAEQTDQQTAVARVKTPTQVQTPQQSSVQNVEKNVQYYEKIYRDIAEQFNIKEILGALKSSGLQFTDLHSDNLMKRGGTYVLIDLGYAKGGAQVQKPLAEKKKYLKDLILEIIKNG
jgi:uncharacterized protein YneR